ncbi:MAG: DUF5305 family protein [Bacilli bacterium]|jgi:hypothetical protein|nr:DUF5305 family protein [Bacilli bacterium]
MKQLFLSFKLNLKKLYIPIVLSLAIISIFIIIVNIVRYFNTEANNILYEYNVFKDAEYQVHLVENNFIEEKILGMDQQYIMDLVDFLDLTFIYTFSGLQPTNLTYRYYITASLIGSLKLDITNYEQTEEKYNVWQKEYEIKPETLITVDDSKFTIIEKYNLSLDKYNELIDDFVTRFGITINPFLNLKMEVIIEGSINKENFIINDDCQLNIPLGNKTFFINKMDNNDITGNVKSNKIVTNKSSWFFIVNIILLIIIVVLLFIYIRKLIKNSNQDSYYEQINKIKCNYGMRIVDVLNMIKTEQFDLLEVSAFSELLDYIDEAGGPILCWQNKKRKEQQTWFFIIKGNVMYRYIINKKNYNNNI